MTTNQDIDTCERHTGVAREATSDGRKICPECYYEGQFGSF